MSELKVIEKNGCGYIDSREVAEAIGKRHDHLLRDINRYCKTLETANAPKIGVVNFFVENSYHDAKGEMRLCYLVTKMGCEMIANKLTGDKGILFTAAYIAKFNEMEQREHDELEELEKKAFPQLADIKAIARLTVQEMKDAGVKPEEVTPLFIPIDFVAGKKSVPRWYNASAIARECGIYSLNGNPHCQAVSCILNEVIFIADSHKRMDTDCDGFDIRHSILYDSHALATLKQWIRDCDYPNEIYGIYRTYRVQYFDR